MKRNLIIIIVALLTSNQFGHAQSLNKEITVYEYIIDNNSFHQIEFNYTNHSSENYVLWIEREVNDSKTTQELIRNYFFKVKGDFSLMQMIWDGNVSEFTPQLFLSFFKIISSGEQFKVSIISQNDPDEIKETIARLEKHFILVNTNSIKGLQIDLPTLVIFNFQPENLIVNEQWLIK